MTPADKIALGSAVISVLSLAATVYFAFRARSSSQAARKSEDRANDIAIGQSGTSMRDSITNARQRIEDSSLRVAGLLQGRKPDKLIADEKRHLAIVEKARSSTIENLLNAYEDACGKYRDDKIDRERFKRAYIREIANLCDPKVASYAKYMHPSSTSNFEAIWKVYEEWHRHE